MTRMLRVGDQVCFRRDAGLLQDYPVLVGAVGTVSRIAKGAQWTRLTSSPAERAADVTATIRFASPLHLVLLNVGADQLEHRQAPP